MTDNEFFLALDAALTAMPRSDRARMHALEEPAKVAEAIMAVAAQRVSEHWLTQEGKPNETAWVPGSSLSHPAWEPTSAECSGGKYHACPAAADSSDRPRRVGGARTMLESS